MRLKQGCRFPPIFDIDFIKPEVVTLYHQVPYVFIEGGLGKFERLFGQGNQQRSHESYANWSQKNC
jgi:hypothetical protein